MLHRLSTTWYAIISIYFDHWRRESPTLDYYWCRLFAGATTRLLTGLPPTGFICTVVSLRFSTGSSSLQGINDIT